MNETLFDTPYILFNNIGARSHIFLYK